MTAEDLATADPDPFAPDALEDPYPLYAHLRERAPVWRVPGSNLFLVTGHREILDVLGAPETYSSKLTALLVASDAGVELLDDIGGFGPAAVLAVTDAPEHTTHRRLVAPRFSERQVAGYESSIRWWVGDTLASCIARGAVDWMGAVASPLPPSTIASVLGLSKDQAVRLREWSDAGVALLGGVAKPEEMTRLLETTGAFLSYCRARVRDAVAQTADEVVLDHVLGDLGRAVHDGALSEDEATAMLLQLVIAGSESTASLIGSAARILAENRGVQMQVRAEPRRIPVLVEEALRLESPFRGHFRAVTRDHDLAGVPLRAGDRLMLMWGAANRDGGEHRRPDDVDFERLNPRAHLGFGWGLHFCVGAPLARLQARIALEELVTSTTWFSIDPSAPPPRHVPSLFVRRLECLHLRLES